ncbi:hypothetical protein GCM10027599_02500 [Yimella radicis]
MEIIATKDMPNIAPPRRPIAEPIMKRRVAESFSKGVYVDSTGSSHHPISGVDESSGARHCIVGL